MTLVLPEPDQFGNYVFGKRGPWIYPYKQLVVKEDESREVRPTGKYTVLVSEDKGFILGSTGWRKMFKTAASAFEALKERLR